MQIICALIWMIATGMSMLYAVDCFQLYSIPVLKFLPYHRQTLLSAAVQTEQLPEKSGGSTLKNAAARWAFAIAAGTVLAGLCGYLSWDNAVDQIALFRMGSTFVWVAAASIVDGATHHIPNRFPLLICGSGAIALGAEFLCAPQTTVSQAIASGLGLIAGAGLLLIISLLTHGGIGMGDVKLFGAIGFALGLYGAFYTLFLSLLCSALAGVGLLLSKRGTAKRQIPFGPFVLAGLGLSISLGLV